MGAFASRENAGVEELDIPPSHAYRYPPKSGCYFGSYFIMGGERFESTQPEAYLFGENQDLNFLGSRPLPFPYPAPQSNEPTKTIKSLVNIRKDSLRLVRVVDDDGETEAVSHRVGSATSKDGVSLKSGVEIPEDDEDSATSAQRGNGQSPPKAKYNIEFTFDADARCAITILYFASETIESNHAIYMPRDVTMSSETYRYKKGANQLFVQASHVLEPGRFPDEDWQLSPNKDVIPIVIQCVVEDDDHVGHSHMTFACVERVADGYTIKALKQKQMVDGLCYLLQEIYGIENKKAVDKGVGGGGIGALCDDETDDNGSECVICMSDVRDTLILPCRHLCLCNGCADSLRYQANNCPICRAPFRALLQIRAMRKKTSTSNEPSPDECPISQEGCPPGYEAISLIEALNGPATPTHQVASSEEGAVVPSAPLEALASGGSSRASAAKVKRRVSRTGSERASVRSASGNPPTLGADIQPTTPSTTPLLHHPAGATSLPSKTHEVAHGSPVVVGTQNERGACGSDCIRRSLRSSSAKESGVSVPRCQSLEEESDFAIVSIPARRARIAKMGEDVESLGSTMSESPSRDVVVAKTTTVNVSPTLSMCGIDSSGCDEEDESDEEDPSPTPPMDEAPTPTQPATPIGAVEEEHLKTPISTAPVAADV